jgi:general secretion pathway protein E
MASGLKELGFLRGGRGEMVAQSGVDDPKPTFAEKLSDQLVAAGIADRLAVDRAQRAARHSGERFDHVLIKLGMVAEDVLFRQIAQCLGMPFVNDGDFPSEMVLPDLIPRRFVLANRAFPLRADAVSVHIVVSDPLDMEVISSVSYATGLVAHASLAIPSAIERGLEKLYGDNSDENLFEDLPDVRAENASEHDLQRLKDIANEAPTIRRVNQIISGAVEARASDIHIEPNLDAMHVRYRIDGVMRTVDSLPPGLSAAIASRIKIMARLDIAERRLPQDGRIRLAIKGIEIDFRVSTVPTVHGESIVLRILDRSRVVLNYEALGFDIKLIEILRKILAIPNGIILVTGPTGSGKTTTLYTALSEINTPDVKVFTVEDPVEYQLTRVNQIQVQPAIGLDFPNALRAILRQDPDVIMIGEIRDAETARIAIQASLTGHLVLSTLHTNSAAASITRLIDMGVESYLIASTVKAVLAQRLVRRLCQHCAAPHPSAEHLTSTAPMTTSAMGPPKFSTPKGCAQCKNTGFSGRSTIAELLVVDDHMHRLVSERVSDTGLDQAARKAGMMSLYQSGYVKAWQGHTSIEEVLRVVRID